MYLKKFITFIIRLIFTIRSYSIAYPIFAQQNYKAPREANGRIVCANCHLAQGPVQLDMPQAVLPGIVFEAKVRIPYAPLLTQLLGNGKRGGLNVGAVLILPNGFQLAPLDRLSARDKEKTKGLYFQPYRAQQTNILVVGPVPGKTYTEMTFPILAPYSTQGVSYGKYPVYLGGNRGRGQVYPDGSKSNNTLYVSSSEGVISDILPLEKKGGYRIVVETKNGAQVIDEVPAGPKLIVKIGQNIRVDQPLTNNPNVGRFGQADEEIVLQCRERIQGLLFFFRTVFFAQVFLVLKKKQFEKYQLAEIDFLSEIIL
jgi:apocytochrome f